MNIFKFKIFNCKLLDSISLKAIAPYAYLLCRVGISGVYVRDV